jgi:hypothetical protein
MINTLKNNITIRKGFVIGVISLVLFNFILIGSYYVIHLNNEANSYHTKIRTELTKEIKNIKKIINDLTNKNSLNEKELDKKLNSYAKNQKLKIEISDQDNKIIKTYNYNETKKIGSRIIVSEISNYNNLVYLITVSYKQDIIGINVIIDFLVFELIIFSILG